MPPALGELLALLAVTIVAKGPQSFVVPFAYEPIVIVYGRLHPPLVVAAVAVLGTVIMEWVNYHFFRAVIESRACANATRSPTALRVAHWFRRQPFLAVVLGALLPLPFGLVRIAALLARYPARRHVAATAVGRFPRYWLYAAVGAALPLPPGPVVAVGLVAAVLPLVLYRAGLKST
ncbi:MAG TPA: VTT domain-containing protein [Gemmatimonadales bacterium]|jgi:uncharacterized membrane protein YdjX (TVP38/TMEM64 family)|nr:VTT domain-containing protein [Gemmatimonadales bacterium]